MSTSQTKEIDFKPEDMIEVRGSLYKPNHYTLLIRLNDNCNLDCVYCTMHQNTNRNKHVTPYVTIMEYITVTYNKILSLDKFMSINYYFYGGEPTMYRDFDLLMKSIHTLHSGSKLDYLIETQTNLTKPIEFFRRLKPFNIKFICSYQNAAQRELYGNKDHIPLYIEKAKYLMENNLTHGFDIMLEDPESEHYTRTYYHPKPDEIKEVYYNLKQLFQDTKMEVKFGIQMNTIDSVPVPDIYKDIYLDHKTITEKLFITVKNGDSIELKTVAFNDIISNQNYNNFRFWYCDVGLRQFMISFINETPDVWWCMADMFAKSKSLAQNIEEYKILLDSTFNINKSPRCIHKKCSCELFIPKRKTR